MNNNNLINKRFTRLTVRKYLGILKGRKTWFCQCDCGNTKQVTETKLKLERVKSCGCLAKETASILAKELSKKLITHGKSKTRIFRIWSGMLNRCNNPNNSKYINYGGRGIRVCNNWKKFDNFYKDMGDVPLNKSIDRINNDGNYCKNNCKWSTPIEQANNTRKNKIIFYNRENKTLSQWVSERGKKYKTIHKRITYLGWSLEKALSR